MREEISGEKRRRRDCFALPNKNNYCNTTITLGRRDNLYIRSIIIMAIEMNLGLKLTEKMVHGCGLGGHLDYTTIY